MHKAADSYTDDEVYRMRQYLAKRWRQHVTQVTDTEARAYLDVERELEKELAAHMKHSPSATGERYGK